ncbi:MAG: hypothetical protein V3V33_04380 [Candidatus Lokiarchaeia archaeon]
MKKNCWQLMNCGREMNGGKIGELGICPTATETKLNGVHSGKNAGRSCWVVAGTLCGGAEQGTFAMKYQNCRQCDFYKEVKTEEKSNFFISKDLLDILHK